MCAKEPFLQDLYTQTPMYNQLLQLYWSLQNRQVGFLGFLFVCFFPHPGNPWYIFNYAIAQYI